MLLAGSAAAQSVTISSPANNSAVSSPVTVTASFTGSRAKYMSISADGVVQYTVHNRTTITDSLSLAPGTHTVVVQSSSGGALYSAKTTFLVQTAAASTVGVSVSPSSVSLQPGTTQQFTATVTGTTNTSVNWSATSGTISYMGYYTAPSTPGTYTVTATSVADSTKSGSSIVTVISGSATNRYLSSTGVDTGSCTNASSPCLTFHYVDSIAASGDVVHVAPGTYNLTSSTCIVTNTSGVTWQSDVHGAATINGGGNCLYLWHSSGAITGNIKIFGFQFTGIQVNSNLNSMGMLLEGGQGNFEVAYNTFHDSGSGCTSTNCFGSALDVTPYGSGAYTGRTCNIHDNTFYNLAVGLNSTYGGYSIYATCSNGSGDADPRIYNNLIYNEGSIGIHMWHSADHVHVYNNTIDEARMGILVGTGDAGGNLGAIFDVTNNIVSNSYYGIYAEDGGGYTLSSSSTFDNNLTYNNLIDWGYNGTSLSILTSFQAANNISGNPLYVDPAAGNYVIGASSPAIGAGLGNTYTPQLDLAGVTRPNPPSIGAYEP